MKATEGIARLKNATCPFSDPSPIRGSVVVDQVYAEMQHEALEFRHPRGGQAKYLTTPLLSKTPSRLSRFADRFLSDAAIGVKTFNTWNDTVVDPLAGDVEKLAPLFENDLKQSASVTVTDGGVKVVSKPAKQRRLTDEEASAKSGRWNKDARG